MNYLEQRDQVLNDPDERHWLKTAVTWLDHTDPADALRDVTILYELTTQRWNEAIGMDNEATL